MSNLIGYLPNFFEKSIFAFDIYVRYNGTLQNLVADTVTLMLKSDRDDEDSEAVMSVSADTATYGENGIAAFTITAADSAITPGTYQYDILWQSGTSIEEVIMSGSVTVMKRVKD